MIDDKVCEKFCWNDPTQAENLENVAEESRNLSHLLEQFRIDFKDVIVIKEAHKFYRFT